MSELRWNCKERGECFVECKHVKLEMFDDLFLYGIQTCDIDGITEIGGHFLLQEWKDTGLTDIPTGQKIMFEQMTRHKEFTVIVVYGDAKLMTVGYIEVYSGGKSYGREQCDFNELRERIRRWAAPKYAKRFQ